jgi:ankyrin repeat protein
MVAAKAGHLDAMKALIDAGADPKIKRPEGSTLLMAAAASGHVDVVKYAAELNPGELLAVNAAGDNAVIASVSNGAGAGQPAIVEVIQFLADKGVDVDVKNALGKTALSIADFSPIDQAVDRIVLILTQQGRKPIIPSAR